MIQTVAALARRTRRRLDADAIRGRLDRETFGPTAQSAAAAGIAWELPLQLPNHGQPFFAPIAAVIALAADRGRRGRQATHMILGVGLGIVLGAAIVAVAGVGAWQLVVTTALALLVATAVGAPPVIRTQAAASAILVVALHVPGSSLALQRLVDALIGGGLAILMARFLFPVDPLDLVRREAVALRRAVGDVLDGAADAIDARDRARAERVVVRRAPRRRPLRRRLDALGTAWHELDRSVADGRAIGAGAVRLVSQSEPSPPAVRGSIPAMRATGPPRWPTRLAGYSRRTIRSGRACSRTAYPRSPTTPSARPTRARRTGTCANRPANAACGSRASFSGCSGALRCRLRA